MLCLVLWSLVSDNRKDLCSCPKVQHSVGVHVCLFVCLIACVCMSSGPCSHTVQKLKSQDISAITAKSLKVIPERIIDNYNKRQQPRFRWGLCFICFSLHTHRAMKPLCASRGSNLKLKVLCVTINHNHTNIVLIYIHYAILFCLHVLEMATSTLLLPSKQSFFYAVQ